MKPKQTYYFRTLLVSVGSAALLSGSASAANATWNNPAANTNLNNGANWSSGSATFADGDTATWDGTQTGNLSLQWTAGLGPGSGAAGGLNLSILGTNTGALQLDGVTGQNFGIGNITIASGAGAFTLGDGVGTATVVYRAPVAATAFTNNSSNTATIKSDVSFLNGGGVGNRVVTFTGTGNWLAEGTVISATNFGGAATSAALVKSGTGTLTLAGANGYGGSTTLNDGVLAVSNGAALGSGGAMAINGSFGTRLEVSNNITLAGPTAINLTGRNNTTDNTSAGASIRNVSGSNAISSNLVFANVGGTNVNILSSAGTLTLNGTLSTTLTTGVRTFNLTGAGDIVSNGVINNGSGTVGIIKDGAGTLTLTNSGNSYSGPTTVTAGKLIVNGNITTSVVSVSTGATIGGSGSVGGALTVASGAFLAPGNSAGNLTLGNGLTLAGSYAWELGALSTANPGTDFDTVTVTSGSVDITGAVLQLSLGAFAPSAVSFWQTDQTWAGIINNTGAGNLNGAFAAIDNSAWSSLGAFSTTNTGNDVNLVWTAAVPEPGAALLGGIGVLALLRRRRA